MREVLPLAKSVVDTVEKAPVENEKLKRLTRRRRQFVEEKVRVVNRLPSDLQAVSPGLLEITTAVGNIWLLTVLTCREDLTRLAGIKRTSLLKIPGIGPVTAAKVEA